ncbi:MAG: MerR family transcriptional regulator [Betaproteobacteria bacterium]
MEYTVQRLAAMAGVSPRTLRHYDEIGLLKPARTTSSGYRIYGRAEVDRLQQILFYRELGVGLDTIKEAMTAPSFDAAKALREHRDRLLDKKAQLELLIANVNKTIDAYEGRMTMTDQEKFEGFKRQLVEESERKYGAEVRAKYGDQVVDRANQRLLDMTPQQHEEVTRLGEQVMETLAAAFATGDPAGEMAQRAADLHRQWLTFFWSSYSKEAHAGVAQMYVDDPRFTAFYDAKQPGMAKFLRDAILIYTGMNR